MRQVWTLCVAAPLLTGCLAAPTGDPRIRITEAADISRYSTFAFRHEEPTIRRSLSFPSFDARAADAAIRSTITDSLMHRNFASASQDAADLLITYTIDVNEFSEMPDGALQQHFQTRDSRDGIEGPRRIEISLSVVMAERHTGITLFQRGTVGDWSEYEDVRPVVRHLVENTFQGVPARKPPD